MVLRVHNVSKSGATISEGDPFDDEDPMTGMPPGTRIHKDGEIDAAATSPTEEQVAAARAAPRRSLPTRRTSPVRQAPKDANQSDRRRCLELAISTGQTDPAEILRLARQFADFLEGN